MRYRASVEVDYWGGQLPDDVPQALAAGIRDEVGSSKRITLTSLLVTFQRTGILTVETALAGIEPDDLTNPLHALTILDKALDEALVRGGLFEEFDVSRKRLTVTPVPWTLTEQERA